MDIKIVPLGAGGVGKTALIDRLQHDHFLEEYDPTTEEAFRSKQIVIDDEALLPEFLDYGGDEFTSLRDLYIQRATAILLVYSITSLDSFEEIQKQYHSRIFVKDENKLVPIALIGNKCDLEAQRSVSKAMGEQLAKQYGVPFFETSAKTNINVWESLVSLIREQRRIKTLTNPPAENNKKDRCILS